MLVFDESFIFPHSAFWPRIRAHLLQPDLRDAEVSEIPFLFGPFIGIGFRSILWAQPDVPRYSTGDFVIFRFGGSLSQLLTPMTIP